MFVFWDFLLGFWVFFLFLSSNFVKEAIFYDKLYLSTVCFSSSLFHWSAKNKFILDIHWFLYGFILRQ